MNTDPEHTDVQGAHESQASNEQEEQTQTTVPNTPPASSSVETATKKPIDVKIIAAGLVLIAALIAGYIYFIQSNDDMNPFSDSSGTTQIDPATVRAVVNGEEITQETLNERLQEAAQALAAQGIDLNNPDVRSEIEAQVLEDTISYVLLKQGALEAGIDIPQSDIDAAYEGYVTQLGGEEQLIAQLQQINLTSDDFKKRLKEQLLLDAYVNQSVDVEGITVTDEDVQAFYDNAVSSIGDSAPPLDDVRSLIIDQLTKQEKQKLVKVFTDSLRENATIEIK